MVRILTRSPRTTRNRSGPAVLPPRQRAHQEELDISNIRFYDGQPPVVDSQADTPEELLRDIERYGQFRSEYPTLLLGFMGNVMTRAEVGYVLRAKHKLAAATRLFNKKILEMY